MPVAANPDGTPVTGPVLARLADAPAGTRSRPLALLATPIPYDAASLDTSRATLTTRRSETRAGQVGPVADVAPGDWAFADCTSAPFPGTPNPRMLCLKSGFDPALLYQLSYEARDPKVLGIGFAVNDSGTVVPAIGACIAIPLLIAASVRTLELADSAESGAPDEGDAPAGPDHREPVHA